MQQVKNTDRFTGKAGTYERSRPSYPADAVRCLMEHANLSPGDSIADIGAGTGKLTRMLLEQGLRVTAVEPNADMLNALSNLTSPNLNIIHAPAEQTTLPPRGLDAITVAQAFHWFNHEQCKAEFNRILKPGGRVALFWNSRDKTHPVTGRLGDLMEQYRVRDMVCMDMPQDTYARFFRAYQIFNFPYAQLLDAASLLALAVSRSYSPTPGDPQYPLLQTAVQTLFQETQKDGFAEVRYQTSVVLGTI